LIRKVKPMKGLWNWERCKARIHSLRGRLGFSEDSVLRFLGLGLHLEDGSVYDYLTNRPLKEEYRTLSDIYCILSSYADAEPTPTASNLVTSKQLQGGRYCNVMVGRATSSIQNVFGSQSEICLLSLPGSWGAWRWILVTATIRLG